MGKILLCGNGINIQFNKKFQLNEFIDLLLDETKLKNFADNLWPTQFLHSYKDYDKVMKDFYWILKKCKSSISKAKVNFAKNGVETVFTELFQTVEDYLAFEENNDNEENKRYDNFEVILKNLFFSYIWKLQSRLQNFHAVNFSHQIYKERLDSYMKIITLNYDSLLEKIVTNQKDIIHWHGMISQNSDGSLNYKTCQLETIRNPKSLQSFKQIALFKNNEKYQGKYELDIVGLNPINDNNVFALFINSQICKKINFYYYSTNDLINLEIILKKIKTVWLEKIKKTKNKTIVHLNNKVGINCFNYEKVDNKYLLSFLNENNQLLSNRHLEINLIASKQFWNECKIIKNENRFFEFSAEDNDF